MAVTIKNIISDIAQYISLSIYICIYFSEQIAFIIQWTMILETIYFSCAQAGQKYDTRLKSDNCLKSENYQNLLTKESQTN